MNYVSTMAGTIGALNSSPTVMRGEAFFPKMGKSGKWLFFTAAPIRDAKGDLLGAH